MQQKEAQPKIDSGPFIIWTLRRTGGTNLATALFARSACPTVMHEPFNADRQYGHVTKACIANADEDALRAQLDLIFSRRVLIKHCIESDMVPSRLNALLVEASVAAGYRHVFLYRRNALDRLLSLHFAARSGVWGKKLSQKTVIDDGIFSEPLPVKRLLSHEQGCRGEFRSIHARLLSLGVSPVLVVFEDIYADPAMEAVRARLGSLLDYLGLAAGRKSDDAFIDGIVSGGDQGTRQLYSRFVNYEEMVAGVQGIGEFDLQPRSRFVVRTALPLPDGIDFAEIWPPTAEVRPDRVAVSGVIFSGDGQDVRVSVAGAEEPAHVECGLPSPRVTKRFPGKAAAGKARFRIAGLQISGDRPVRLLCSIGNAVPVEFATIFLAAEEKPAVADNTPVAADKISDE